MSVHVRGVAHLGNVAHECHKLRLPECFDDPLSLVLWLFGPCTVSTCAWACVCVRVLACVRPSEST